MRTSALKVSSRADRPEKAKHRLKNGSSLAGPAEHDALLDVPGMAVTSESTSKPHPARMSAGKPDCPYLFYPRQQQEYAGSSAETTTS